LPYYLLSAINDAIRDGGQVEGVQAALLTGDSAKCSALPWATYDDQTVAQERK